ncbi:MAG: metal-dependent hydrolase [Pseudomonadota bacterium]|nr:MAG: metal-dependent hydrolase [Pseudomonadota bacterium]
MDIVTQGLFGGALAQAVARKEEKKLATFVGIAAGMLADADFFIRSSQDPLLNIEYHRHFTHSLMFIPVGAAIACVLLWPFLHRRIKIGRIYLFCLAGYSMSGILDACTSYGTQLLWPFSSERVAFNIISIIDPVFSLILLGTLLLGLRLRTRPVAYGGLALCVAYLAFGTLQLHRAQAVAETLATTRGHQPTKFVVKPTLANLVLWRSVYEHDGRFYIDAIRVGLSADAQIFEGEVVAKFATHSVFAGLDPASTLYTDIGRFAQFSDDFVAFDPTQENVLGDIRYSMLPNSAKPLWGIVISPAKPQQHADFRFFRDRSQAVRQTFFNMVLGRCADAVC